MTPADAMDDTATPTRILVAEDDPDLLAFAAAVLRSARHEVTLASSAEEALELLQAGCEVDAVFSDIVLPGIDGLELVRRLRSRHPTLAVVLTTGRRDAEVLAAIEETGHRFLRKPYTARQLTDAFAEPEVALRSAT